MKVLLIDDDQFIQAVYKSALSQENIEVVLSSDGEDGMQKAISEVPDLVLLDMLLPKKDGFDVIHDLKSNPALAQIPIIVISALSQDADIAKVKELGAVEYLPKGQFSPQEVTEKIKNILIKQ